MCATCANADTGSQLLRSRAQIVRVLAQLAARREVVTAELPGKQGRFVAHITHADPGGRFIILTGMEDESANSALLARPRVTFVSGPGNWHIEFVAAEPRGVIHDGAAGVRLHCPEILSVQKRRLHSRLDVPPALPLRCIADAGGITPFEAQIRDISLGGMSFLLYPGDITLEPGTVLVGCRIEAPGVGSVTVDLEVRYTEVVKLPDGGHARCSGFRFVNALEEVHKLLDVPGLAEASAR